MYFLGNDGSTFKSTVLYDPYFYLLANPPKKNGIFQSSEEEDSVFFESLVSNLIRRYEGLGLKSVEKVKKHDLDAVNHLGEVGSKGRTMLKLTFDTVQQLMDVRKEIQPIVKMNQEKEKEAAANPTFALQKGSVPNWNESNVDPMTFIVDMREYDVPYLVRVCIDLGIRAGAWYTVTPNHHDCGVTLSEEDIETKADPHVLAFDIECTKAPLKFPDANVDSIFMISYMVNGQGYLIISRHVVGDDIQDFEYTPKPSYPGPFKIFNELTEEDLIRRFLSEFERLRPQIVVTYNGDFFDWPFLEQRAAMYGLDLKYEIGVERVGGGDSNSDGEYRGRSCVHMDAFSWVKRDSYLPQGSQGLKAVTKYKLGYDPVEVDPEDMVQFARDRPLHMASYSVSDAVATYYLYMKYVHMFVFSLCTIIPMGPEDVLRKGSGTLCEALLMVQACTKNIICPNKEKEPLAKFHEGHLLESETYIGGKVECLETGVYRSDIEYKFDLKPSAFQMLIDNIDRDLTFAIEVEGGIDRNTITNYDEIRCQIIEQLEMLRDRPNRTEKPYVYHLDVGAMYPNIILTNRLQPSAMVDDSTCAACDYNQSKNNCKRKMNWVWRGDYNPATRGDYERAKDQLSRERFENGKGFHELDEKEQAGLISKRLKDYSKNAYKRTKVTSEVTRTDTVCMRENDFYVDTVRNFRDKRYELKKLTKVWGKKIKEATDAVSRKEAEDKELVYDSLQVAHKCILNSFYGYVMRKGARWRSMEMAGIVTKTGADLITQARILVEQIGRPLELDTDGIWCILPQSFPDVFYFKTKTGSSLKLEYPCIMLNADVHNNFTNHQYQTLVDPEKRIYETRSECSIFFEVDGPYRCMVLPSSTEEGKLLKKRYAVFNFDGSLAELKGFELKRRGELELIKTFQNEVFERFLEGESLSECYDAVADVANYWLDVLDTQGESLETDELFDLISENRSMSRQLEDYGDQKGTSQTTARRLGEFLGAEIIKDKGLNCKFIIAEKPHGAPVTERAIPTAIWKSEPPVMKHYLKKWLKSPGMKDEDFDIRNILDWDYYRDRLAKTIQKIITIPAALQRVPNPVPRLPHPEWLQKTVRKLYDKHQQQSITSMFAKVPKKLVDIEDMVDDKSSQISKRPTVHVNRRKFDNSAKEDEVEELEITLSTKRDNHAVTPDRVVLSKDTFQEWLIRKKHVWNFSDRRKRKRGMLKPPSSGALITDSPSKKPKKASGSMAGYIREASQSLASKEWHILEIRNVNSSDGSQSSFNGEFVMWIMLSNGNMQRLNITMNRTFFVSCTSEVPEKSTSELTVKRVEKHLPHNKSAKFLYEVSMPELTYRNQSWLLHFRSAANEDMIESLYEMNTSELFRSLIQIGCICRMNPSAKEPTGKYSLKDLKFIESPKEGAYLNTRLSFRKIFLFERLHARSQTGIVSLFIVNDSDSNDEVIDLTTQCYLWIVRPSGEKGQKNISKKICESMFSELLQHLKNQAEEVEHSGYSAISLESICKVESLDFVNGESNAFKGAQDVLNAYAQDNKGPTLLLVNSTKSATQLRKGIPSCNSFPLISLPPPPGTYHSSSIQSINWEKEVLQRSLESYFYMGAESLSKHIEYARYAKLPLGNLGCDPVLMSYDTMFARILQKNRSLLWTNEKAGSPDTGINAMALLSGSSNLTAVDDSKCIDSNTLWGDDDDNLCPVIRFPGAYRCIVAEIDIHNLAIAALSDSRSALPLSSSSGILTSSTNSTLGDEMSTAVSLPLLRILVQTWLRDAATNRDAIADQLLCHLYRLISTPEARLSDPALHRMVVSLMKGTFSQLLGEFQRLGSTIISASFHRITIATNKNDLSEAIEYVNFVLATIQNRLTNQESTDFARMTLQPNQYYTHFLFLDDHNFGGIRLENRKPVDEEAQWAFEIAVPANDGNESRMIVTPTSISGWNIMHYLASEISQEYFRLIVSRFSKDVYHKQVTLLNKNSDSEHEQKLLPREQLLEYKKKLVSKHLSADLTRAVAEILSDGGGPESFPQLPGSHLKLRSPALEFIKNVIVVLELDPDVDKEVQNLKKSLLAQIGVQEYSNQAKWENPCASFILPDIFCSECQESRDVDLCVIPPPDENQIGAWTCDDCDTPFDSECIERRLIDIIEQKCIRYQLQDLRCAKTSRVATRSLARQSETSQKLHLDISREETKNQIQILSNLAKFYNLEWLGETTDDLLRRF